MRNAGENCSSRRRHWNIDFNSLLRLVLRQRFLNGVNWLLSVNSHSPMTTADQRSVHVPVMPREVMQWLQLSAGLTVLDGTLGAGGHSRLILKSLGETGRLIGLDRDPMMLALATQNLASIQHPGTSFVRSSYADAETVLQTLGMNGLIECCWIWVYLRTSFRIENVVLVLMPADLWICGFIRTRISRFQSC